MRVTVAPDPIEPGALVAEVSDRAAGAVVQFLGTVRDHSEGKTGVTHLEYEVYPGQVEPKITQIVDTAASRWGLKAAVVVHRTGEVRLGEASVAVTVSAPHRAEAFEAARFIIDQLKENTPIWKKEYWSGGAEWVRGS